MIVIDFVSHQLQLLRNILVRCPTSRCCFGLLFIELIFLASPPEVLTSAMDLFTSHIATFVLPFPIIFYVFSNIYVASDPECDRRTGSSPGRLDGGAPASRPSRHSCHLDSYVDFFTLANIQSNDDNAI